MSGLSYSVKGGSGDGNKKYGRYHLGEKNFKLQKPKIKLQVKHFMWKTFFTKERLT